MKKILLAAAAATATLSSAIMSTPAYAFLDEEDEDYSGVTLTSVDLNGDYSAQQICDEALRPAAASGFTTSPTTVDDSGWANDGEPERDEDVGDPVATGTPTASNVIVENSFYRNGGSPNVWAAAEATLTYPGSTQAYTTVQNLKRTLTVGCYVSKTTRGGHLVVPPGLQTTGNVATATDQVAGPNGLDTNNGPLTFQGERAYVLVCISPGKKGGTWTGKHGFASSACAAASTAAGGTIPSGNIPVL